MKKLYLLFFSLLALQSARGQYSVLKTAGDKAFKNADYFQAAYYYSQITDKRKLKQEIPFYASDAAGPKTMQREYPYICYQLAESYRLYHDYNNARRWYDTILVKNLENDFPLTRLWHGVCLRSGGDYADALKELKRFKAGYAQKDAYADLAEREINDCIFAMQQTGHPNQVDVTQMENPWNVDGGSFALSEAGGRFWFTSSRLNNPGEKHSNNIYSTGSEKGAKPQIVNLKAAGTAANFQYGPCSLTSDGKRLYFSGWYKKDGKTVSAIYLSEQANGEWSSPRKLNEKINPPDYNAAQPFVTADGTMLFYASDKPGGIGGYDIWISRLDASGDAKDSYNPGSVINTAFDEQAPFYQADEKRLVYSSKGFTGLGGFDLYQSNGADKTWTAPENLGYPTNSARDDIYYFPDSADKNKFYLSSDRASDCCLTLFRLNRKFFIISGKVIACGKNEPLDGVEVIFSDSFGKQTMQTKTDGLFSFQTINGGPFKISVKKQGYAGEILTSVLGRSDSTYKAELCLQQYQVNKPILLKNVLFDFNKADLRPQSKDELDTLVTIMRDNPTFKVELASHTDSVGSDAYNLKLSQMRAQSCVDYIVSKGIGSDRIYAKGYGRSRPVAPNSLPNGADNPAGRQANRRTEFTIVNK